MRPTGPASGRSSDSSPLWAFKHVEYCASRGIVRGYADGSYHPEVAVTRDQMAVYIARALGLPL